MRLDMYIDGATSDRNYECVDRCHYRGELIVFETNIAYRLQSILSHALDERTLKIRG